MEIPVAGSRIGDSIVLAEEMDQNYTPTDDEITDYAKWLGMDPDMDRHLFWIASEGLKVIIRWLRA